MSSLSSSYTHEQITGAKWILSEALGATSGASVLVIHDESTANAADCLKAAASEIGVLLTPLRVTAKAQTAYQTKQEATLSDSIRDELDNVTRVVLLQQWSPASTAFRFAVLKYCSRCRGSRVASMPGVSLEYFDMCRGDLDLLGMVCQ